MAIIDQASLAVQAVFVFTLAAGIAVLFAAVQSTIDERRFESAMLRALGVKRRMLLSGVLTEFAALGFAAALLASAGASILAAVIAVPLFELDYNFNPMLWILGPVGVVVVVCLSGFVAARGAISARGCPESGLTRVNALPRRSHSPTGLSSRAALDPCLRIAFHSLLSG